MSGLNNASPSVAAKLHDRVLVKLPENCGHHLQLGIWEGKITEMDFIAVSDQQGQAIYKLPKQIPNGAYLEEQFQAYFNRPNQFNHESWDIELIWPKVSEYQIRVCQFLQTIPYGQTLSYGDAAKKLNSAARAVGGACRRNPFPIIFPCHRVVAKNGIGGYSGDTQSQKRGEINKINIKQFLLAHEQQN